MGVERYFLDLWIRRRLQNPTKILQQVGLASGHVFLDVGCGTGFLSIPAAEIVGREGLVYAVDVDGKSLKKLVSRSRGLGLTNILAVEADASNMHQVRDMSVDKAIMFLTLHHIERKHEALAEVFRKLKRDAVLTLVDPIRSTLFHHGTNPSELQSLLQKSCFELVDLSKGRFTWRATLRRPLNMFTAEVD